MVPMFDDSTESAEPSCLRRDVRESHEVGHPHIELAMARWNSIWANDTSFQTSCNRDHFRNRAGS